jgi:hypothetical protein
MTDDLRRIEKSFSKSIAALRSINTALEIINLLREKKLEINPLMGKPVVIKTLEPNHKGEVSQHFLRVTKLSMEVLQGKMEALRHLDPSLGKTLTLNTEERVDGLMRPTNDGTGTPVITISLVDRERT